MPSQWRRPQACKLRNGCFRLSREVPGLTVTVAMVEWGAGGTVAAQCHCMIALTRNPFCIHRVSQDEQQSDELLLLCVECKRMASIPAAVRLAAEQCRHVPRSCR